MQEIKVFGYARKSPDDEEKTEVSINNQIKLIESSCKKKNWIVEKIFIDKNISGGDRFRKGFVDMIDKIINSKEVKIIVVKDQDRFARDSAFFMDTLRDLDVREIKVFSIIKNNFLSHEDLGDVVTSVVDGHYVITQRKKAVVILNQKKEEGMPPFNASFGYKSKKGKWIIVQKNAEIVRQVCEDYVNNVSFKETIKRLKINNSLYYRIIKNAKKGIYNGFVFYIRKYKDSNGKVVKTEEVKYKANFEPTISEELFNKINRR